MIFPSSVHWLQCKWEWGGRVLDLIRVGVLPGKYGECGKSNGLQCNGNDGC